MKIKPIQILLVEDNEDDIIITQEAFAESKLLNLVKIARDGEEAMNYLEANGKYKNGEKPSLILLDINMPKKNGFEVLDNIKQHPSLKHLPVIMLTVSDLDKDIVQSYAKGACSFIKKPINFDSLRQVVKEFELYWTIVSKIPDQDK